MATGSDPAETAQQLNRDLQRISSWATKWKVLFNAKKSKDVIFSKKCLNNSPPLLLNETVIDRVNTHKHLGIILTSSLDFSLQVNEVCLKANRKLSVLRSVKLLNRQTLDILYKLTVRSVIDYALPVYYKSLKQTEIGRLENIQYRAGKIVSGALDYTSKEKLNLELGWESIIDRGNLLSLNIFHKIHRHETRPLIRNCMPKLDIDRQHFTRSKGGYIPFKYKNDKFNSFVHADTPECLCHFKSESPEHFFLQCFLYSPERQILFGLIEHYIPSFPNLNQKQKLDIILRGIYIDNPEFIGLNKTLTKAVQNFIISTKRFITIECND